MKSTGRLTGAAFVLLALSLPAYAQTADHPSCAPWKTKWAEASAASGLAAVDDVIGKIPALCSNLKAEATAGRAGAARRIEQERATRAAAAAKEQAAREAAVRAADPCIQARNDWAYMQTASETTVRAYRDALPAACVAWRSQADDRLNALEQQRIAAAAEAERKRVAAEQAAEKKRIEAERIQKVIAGARATGVEGRWDAINRVDETCDGSPEETYAIDGEYLVNTFVSSGKSYRFKISRFTSNEVWTLYSSGDGREAHYAISGNILRFNYQDTPNIVHTYVRC